MGHRRAVAMVALALASFASGLAGARPAFAAEAPLPRFVAAGSGSGLAAARLLAARFQRGRRDVVVEIPPSIGSTGAVQAVAKGAIALGLVSRPLRPAEAALRLNVVPYARTAIVIAVNPDVADDAITGDELVAIYRGARTRWRDGREIVVFTREAGDSSIEALEREIPGFREAYAESQRARRWTTVITDAEMNRMLARTPAAIGLSDLGTMSAERVAIKALTLNGVKASPATVRSGQYRLVKTLAFVFRHDALPEPASAFLAFARSVDGERVLRAHSYVEP